LFLHTRVLLLHLLLLLVLVILLLVILVVLAIVVGTGGGSDRAPPRALRGVPMCIPIQRRYVYIGALDRCGPLPSCHADLQAVGSSDCPQYHRGVELD
jgi:hypothetical protein